MANLTFVSQYKKDTRHNPQILTILFPILPVQPSNNCRAFKYTTWLNSFVWARRPGWNEHAEEMQFIWLHLNFFTYKIQTHVVTTLKVYNTQTHIWTTLRVEQLPAIVWPGYPNKPVILSMLVIQVTHRAQVEVGADWTLPANASNTFGFALITGDMGVSNTFGFTVVKCYIKLFNSSHNYI